MSIDGNVSHAPRIRAHLASPARRIPRHQTRDLAARLRRLYGVRDTRDDGEPSLVGDVTDVFVRREDAEAMVAWWDIDEPDDAGALEVVEISAPSASMN